MTIEQFDMVDEHDEKIGVTNKSEAHEQGYIHRIVAVYVFSAEGELYVQHHEKSKLLDHSVGGHVTMGESYDEAATRETLEELGLDAPLTQLDVFYSDETFTGSNYRHMIGLYTCIAPKEWNFAANDEVRIIEAMELSVLVEHMNASPSQFTPGFLNSMEHYLKVTDSQLVLTINK